MSNKRLLPDALLKGLHASVTAPCVTLLTYFPVGPGMRPFERLAEKTELYV